MSSYVSKIGFSNHRDSPQVVAVEPWAHDFTLMPGEELEVIAYGNDAAPYFHVVEWEGTSQVHCEDCTSFEVLQGGARLECGHKRQEVAGG